MRYAKTVRVPDDRVGALIGKAGKTKKRIEEACNVDIRIDSRTGEVAITADGHTAEPFKAVEIVTAIGRGFSEKNAMLLMQDDMRLHVMDIRDFAGKSDAAMARIRGRVIGENGRARRNMERLGRSRISVYGKTVSIIGEERRLRTVVAAVNSILSGGMHAAAYGRLEAANRQERQDKMILWEGQRVGE